MSLGPSHLLYLHGFRSSPQSFKARRLQAWLARHRPDVQWWCPQLPPSPQQAVRLVNQTLAAWPADGFAVVGSSLGGFYATCVAEHWGCAAAVINPAVNPARDLQAWVGTQTAYHDPTKTFEFEAAFIDELRTLMPGTLTRPDRYGGVIAQGDELLDWREMAARYAGSAVRVVEGSDHALSDFDDHLPPLVQFLRLTP